jgi:hypothetical protein
MNEEEKRIEEIKAKKEYIEAYIEKQLKGFKSRAVLNRKASIRQHVLVTFLGAAITILSGLNIDFLNEFTRISVLVLGAIVTVFGAYRTFFDNKDLWIRNTMTSNKLRKARNDFNYYISGKELIDIQLNKMDEFKEQVDGILELANSEWFKIREKE